MMFLRLCYFKRHLVYGAISNAVCQHIQNLILEGLLDDQNGLYSLQGSYIIAHSIRLSWKKIILSQKIMPISSSFDQKLL